MEFKRFTTKIANLKRKHYMKTTKSMEFKSGTTKIVVNLNGKSHMKTAKNMELKDTTTKMASFGMKIYMKTANSSKYRIDIEYSES